LIQLHSHGFSSKALIPTAVMRLRGNPEARHTLEQRSTICSEHAEFGQVDIARLLLTAGADVNAPALTDTDGLGGQSRIFHAATQNGDFGVEVVRLLISRGANLESRCRLPGHYERVEEVFEGTVLDYARLFPGTENQTLEELLRSVQGR
jgi:hypothetical protein